jgi:hypothetical protein
MISRFRFTTLCAVTLVTLWLIPANALAQTEKPANGSISGRVLGGEKPLPNVTVVARAGQTSIPMNAAAPPSAKVLTDAEGYYRLTGLPAGSFVVQPMNPVYVLREKLTPLGQAGRTVNLGEGETVEKIDFNLVKGGVITGRVLDHEGQSALGESVHLLKLDEQGKGTDYWLQNYRMPEIDDLGNYRLYGLPEGRYKVYVGKLADGRSLCVGCKRNQLRRTFHPNVTEEAEAQVVEVTPGSEATGIDIRLAGHLKSFDVQARVVDAETGQPLVGVECGYGNLRPGTTRPSGYGSGFRSGENGVVYFQSVLPGRYGGFVTEAPNGYGEITVFEVTDSDLSGIELKVRRGLSLSGKVTLLGVPPEMQAARLPQLKFRASVESNAAIAPSSSSFNPTPDGSFTLNGLPPGRLKISLSGNQRDLSWLGLEQSGNFTRDGLELNAGEPPSPVRVYLLAGGQNVIRGQVQFLNGVWPEGAVLQVGAIPKQIAGIPPQLLNVRSIQSTFADASGRFTLEQLLPGDYDLTVSAQRSFGTNGPTPAPPALPRIRQAVTVTTGEPSVVIKIDLSAPQRREGNQ